MNNLLLFQMNRPTSAPDEAERKRALDPTKSFLVEAPAGSGKTALLIQRFLKLLAGEDVTDPAQVLAITFTRKATAEMQERIHKELIAAANCDLAENSVNLVTRPLAEAVLKRDRALGWGLLEQPSRMNIQTIDAVCSEIARTLPVLAGSSGALAQTEDAGPLYAEAARRTLMRLGGGDSELTQAIRQLLLHRDGALLDLEGALVEMLKTREQWANLLPPGRVDDERLDQDVLPKLDNVLDREICRALTDLSKLMPPHLQHDLAELAGRLARGSDPAPNSPLALCRELTSAPEIAGRALDHWKGVAHLALTKGNAWRVRLTGNNLSVELSAESRLELDNLIKACMRIDGLREALGALRDLPPVQYPREQWLVVRPVLRILGQVLIDLQAVFLERGQCDFTETAMLARAALRNQSAADDLAYASGRRLRHLLVDEMQDTSSGQYELIELLTRGWGRTGETVFLVGDPKQSIYRFRQARVERFLETMYTGKVAATSPALELVRLTANFRSLPELVQGFNEDFTRLFPDPGQNAAQKSAHVTYQPVSTTRDAAMTEGRKWHPAIVPYSDDPAEVRTTRIDQQTAFSDQICRIARDWQRRPLPADRTKPWKIAVLARSRKELGPVIRALVRAKLPYRALKVDPLNERREILDLLALTRALLHPADRTAWLALLRTPWCGLSLADVYKLAGGDDPAFAQTSLIKAIQTRTALLSADGQERLSAFWPIVSPILQQSGRLPLSQQVERAWRNLGAPAYANADELANVEEYFKLLADAEEDNTETSGGGPRNHLHIIESRLEGLYAAATTDANAIDLLTIHTAKGLEWDVVLVPSLERTAPNQKSKLLDWLELDRDLDGESPDPSAATGIFAPIQSRGASSKQLNKWIRAVENEREAAERKRLFYVACTRAREELHLFATCDQTRTGALHKASNSLLTAAWPAAEEHFAERPMVDPSLVLEFPALENRIAHSLAASTESKAPRTILRIPHLPPAAALPTLDQQMQAEDRPEGSFATRVLGNTLHAFLEYLAECLARPGASGERLLKELPSWKPRIAATLRSGGIGPSEIDAASTHVLKGLTNTLTDPDGLWLLQPHTGARSETAVAVLTPAGRVMNLRVDRSFLAGPRPRIRRQRLPLGRRLQIELTRSETSGRLGSSNNASFTLSSLSAMQRH